MRLLEKIVAAAAPHTCLSCGKEGSLLCAWCMPDAVLPLPARCYSCKRVSDNSRVCEPCRRRGRRLKYVWVRTEYTGTAKELVYRLKFGRARAAAGPIAELMGEALPWLDPEVLIVPVPTASSRRRTRGYDHADLIAQHLASMRGLASASLLVRTGQSRQVGAKRAERLLQLEAAFMLRSGASIKGARILLLDDIVTTGGTLEAAAKVLRQAGASSVDAVAFAQKQ